MPTFKIIATQIGNDAGPFTIKNNLGQVIATGVTRLQLLNGYSFNVATGITSVTATSTGNCTNEITMQIPNEGYWEMEKAGIEEVSDHYGAITTNYVAPVETFVADDVVGIYTGVVSGTGNWLIRGGPEDIAGTTYNGGGLLILTGNNTPGSTTIQSGATVQLGRDLDALTGAIAFGLTTVQAGATLNIVGANEAPGRAVIGDLSNLGTMNITGPDVCGEGNFRNNGYVDNRSLITIDNAKFSFAGSTLFTANTGTFLVKDGATLNTNVAMPATQTIQINGCGKCSAFGKEEGAILYGAGVTIASPIQVQTDSCMKAVNVGLTTFSGPITGSSRLVLDNETGSATRSGAASFTNNTPNFTGTLELRATALYDGAVNTWANADVVMKRNSYIQSDSSKVYKSLSSTDPTSRIVLNGSFGAGITLANNGVTTFAGVLANSTPGTPATLTVNGPNTNQITLTNTGAAYALRALGGAEIIAESGSYSSMFAENGSTISAGKSLTSQATTAVGGPGTLTINNAILAVKAISPTQAGLLSVIGGNFNSTGTFTVDLDEPLVAGTYNILRAGAGTGFGKIPTIGVNNTGLTPTFSWSGGFLRVTLV